MTNGCTVDVPVTITEPDALDGSITAQTNVLCNGDATGSVTVAADAGTGTPGYLYSSRWWGNHSSVWHF